MNWFVFALITILAWGSADLFYKLGADDAKYSHLRTSIAVGLIMGLHAAYTLVFGNIGYDFRNILYYLPVSAMYILSMTVGYFGLKYLVLSVSSPVQNASGAVVSLLCTIFLKETLPPLVIAAVAVISVAIVILGYFEKDELEAEKDKKHSIGFVAFFLPVIYCVIDALGTFFDAWYLDDWQATPLVGVTEDTIEDVANTSYELTFLIVALILAFYVFVIKREKISADFKPVRYVAALCETAGQFTYVYAMSGEAILAAPMVATYSVISMLLSRIFLKEKLSWKQYICIFAIVLGIAVLGIYDM